MNNVNDTIMGQDPEKQDALLRASDLDVKEQMLQTRSQLLKDRLVSFLVDSRYALNIDEII
ncbi:hypothetical protein G6733_05115 [Polynucleobacter paneuropaeus]|jgi:hypothetical protein|uniref:hypothetical protein n=1 Tax=Polynucleobacter paneuropaeus TaxID=2527775 RepID=UPI000DBF3999|nr:hypothetical protein [Polynucleobacter paneuropaeus]AWW48088.1 hypothetical protein DPM17_05220 [Polynucleobacter paneuropaeus]MBT8536486.1 hypothetical protein [Polynucleobacter paneuropaeus]MBT8550009.1 hypothetical protein [Polynucleobacter paneuropaeus]MBT8610084.1 hypothetical protein [Polynucleobacter paneuropaeus]QWC96116.1 hypothetical protein G6733_05115 [Polynucleobacter paneuropaeus]